MKNDHYAFEEKNKQFQKSIEISNKSKETFKIEENSLKEDNKIAGSSKSREKNITNGNATEKNSDSFHRNNIGIFKE